MYIELTVVGDNLNVGSGAEAVTLRSLGYMYSSRVETEADPE